jgi:ABC-2 type transport system ATP-binding protein
LILAQGCKRFEGTLAEARAGFGRRLHVRSAAPAAVFEVLAGVITVRLERAGGAENEYDIELADGAYPQVFLSQAIAAGIALTKFEQAGATLHDIFVSLAGDEASPSTPMAEAAE